jgi:tRNA-dihydrouridine synthase B
MAGVTDACFRRICRGYGAGLAATEMLTSDTSLWESAKSRTRLMLDGEDSPAVVQIAGADPQAMAKAAHMAVSHGADIVDINMGCPAKKVCRKAAGSALMKDEKLVASILEAVVQSVSVPVTLKIRTGWDPENRNAVEIAQLAQSLGIQSLAVHGRSRACSYKQAVDYETVAKVVDAVSIPVFANGNIDSPEKALEAKQRTGAAGLMVGRGAFGQPWIFRQINHYLESGEILAVPDSIETRFVIMAHLRSMHEFYGEYRGLRIARKHIGWYLERLGMNASAIRVFNRKDTALSQIETLETIFNEIELTGDIAA